jgi:anti-anti-sigma regulatory factor
MLHNALRILEVPANFALSTQELHEQFLALYEHAFVIVDLSGLDTLDPAFFVELAQLRLRRRSKGLPLGRLVVDSQHLRTALTAVGFERYWLMYQTREGAIESFKTPPLYA